MRGLSLFVVLTCLWNVCLAGQFISYSFGGRNNMLFIPNAASSGKPLPLFVMLHGCTQNPTDFATGTKMNTYADQYGFFVVYPEQTSSANMNKCWNWFETAHQSRGSGEPALIVSIAQSLSPKYSIDSSRIFVGGLSAGAAMTVILGATYPDVFRGLTVGAGLEYKAATDMIGAFTAMNSGGPNPTTQGGVAYNAMGKYAQTLLVLVVQGTSDYTVYPVNGKQVISQYARTLDLVLGAGTAHGYITDTPTTTTNGQVPGGRAYTTYTYASTKTGETFLQYVTVTGMGHAWSGGSSSGTYTDSTGPDASLLMVNYFLNSTNSSTSTSSSSSSSSSTTGSVTTGSVTTGGSTTSASTTTTTTTGGGSGYVFTSIASEDGFVGKVPMDGFSTTVCQVGGKGGYTLDDYRIILSFDTSVLTQGNFSSAVLTVSRQSLNGAINPLVVDIKQGTFGSSTTLTQMAYYGVPTASNIGSLSIPASDGASSSFQLPNSALQYLTGGVRTQIMLRQNILTTLPSASPSLLQIFDGQATLSVN